MVLDIRAQINCSLGDLIDASISDDYIQQNGLITTQGSCTIEGTITPSIGEIVTFSYTKNGQTYDIPRTLRVLSSFTDPYRNTSKIQLGCKFTYLNDLKEPVRWDAFSDPQNSNYTSSGSRKQS
jgi:hypothetical protein